MKKSLCWIIAFISLISFALADERQVINDSNVFIDAQKFLENSGYVYDSLMVKSFSGKIDVAFGFDSDVAIPEKLYLYQNNYSVTIVANGTNYTSVYENWTLLSASSIVNHNFDGKNKWYLFENLTIQANKTYKVRAWVNVLGNGKYDIAIKRSVDSIPTAISTGRFYFVDPFFNLTTSPSAYWKMDADLNDSIGTNFLVDSGTEVLPGLIGNARKFISAESDKITLSQNICSLVNNDFSLSIWVKFTANSGVSSTRIIASSCNGGALGFAMGRRSDDNKINIIMDKVSLDGNYFDVTTGVNPSNDVWHHFVFIYDNTNKSKSRFYIDNVSVTLTQVDQGSLGATTGATLGVRPDSLAGTFLDGFEDEIFIQNNTQWTSAQVSELYNDALGFQYPFINNVSSLDVTSPLNGSIFYNTSSVPFNISCFGTFTDAPINVTLDNSNIYGNPSVPNNTRILFSAIGLQNGSHSWNATCNGIFIGNYQFNNSFSVFVAPVRSVADALDDFTLKFIFILCYLASAIVYFFFSLLKRNDATSGSYMLLMLCLILAMFPLSLPVSAFMKTFSFLILAVLGFIIAFELMGGE